MFHILYTTKLSKNLVPFLIKTEDWIYWGENCHVCIYPIFRILVYAKWMYEQPVVSVQFSSVPQLCPIPWDPMDHSTPGLPVHHQIPESTQTHIHWVGDAIQSSHPLLSPSPPAFNLSQHQGLFKWVSSSHQVAKVLEFQLQHQPFQ